MDWRTAAVGTPSLQTATPCRPPPLPVPLHHHILTSEMWTHSLSDTHTHTPNEPTVDEKQFKKKESVDEHMFAFAYGFLFRSFHQFYVLVFNLLAIPFRIMKNQGRGYCIWFSIWWIKVNLGFVGAKQMRASTREVMICLRKHWIFTVLKRLAVVWPLVFASERACVACWAMGQRAGPEDPRPDSVRNRGYMNWK